MPLAQPVPGVLEAYDKQRCHEMCAVVTGIASLALGTGDLPLPFRQPLAPCTLWTTEGVAL